MAYRLSSVMVVVTLSLSNIASSFVPRDSFVETTESVQRTEIQNNNDTYSHLSNAWPVQGQALNSPDEESKQQIQSPIEQREENTSVMFIENMGQFDSRERFEVRGANGMMRITPMA